MKKMVNKGYRYRIYPTHGQAVLINKTFGCIRFIYNKMLADRIAIYEKYKDDKESLRKQKYPQPAHYKPEYPWLREVDSLALCNAQVDLNDAYNNFFRDKSVGFPKFKSKKHDKRSYTTNNQKGSIRFIDNNTLRLPKLGDMHIKMHRQLPKDSIIKSATLSQTPTGKYYVSILVEYEIEIKKIKPQVDKVIGLDYSSSTLYVDSEANRADYPKFYRRAEEKLKKGQRKLSRCKKGGKNYEKQRLKVAKLHEKIANQRRDYLHKKSRQIANAYDAVVIEDINMRNIAQGLNLAKSTNDNGYGMLKEYLAYKLADLGKELIVIDKWFPSSKLCHWCHYKNEKLTLGTREWICNGCGQKLERDQNAAINIKNEGCRILGLA